MPNGNQGHMQDGRQQGAVATSNGRGRDVGDIAVTTVAEPVPSPDAPEMRNDVTASSPPSGMAHPSNSCPMTTILAAPCQERGTWRLTEPATGKLRTRDVAKAR